MALEMVWHQERDIFHHKFKNWPNEFTSSSERSNDMSLSQETKSGAWTWKADGQPTVWALWLTA